LQINDVFLDGFTRVRDGVRQVVQGLSDEDLCFQADSQANSIGWLVWHLTRVQDDHVAELAESEQAWTAAGWAQRFALPLDVADTGYGHKADDVGAVRARADQLADYHEAVYQATAKYLGALDPGGYDKIVDRRWDPPVSVGVRLMSVLADDLEHLGQAEFTRGIVERDEAETGRL